MKTAQNFLVIVVLFSILFSCTPSAFITDPVSAKRQRQMMNNRTGRNFLEGGLVVSSAVLAAFTGVAVYQGTEQAYRKMVIQNLAKDTLFVNMVTDYRWKDTAYADIRDIVMPPFEKAKVLVPMGINYNVYFRNDYYATADEKIEINTANMRKIRLKPTGVLPDSIKAKLLPK